MQGWSGPGKTPWIQPRASGPTQDRTLAHGTGSLARAGLAVTEERTMSIREDDPVSVAPEAFQLAEPVFLVSAKDEVLASVREIVRRSGGEARTVYRLRGEDGRESWMG